MNQYLVCRISNAGNFNFNDKVVTANLIINAVDESTAKENAKKAWDLLFPNDDSFIQTVFLGESDGNEWSKDLINYGSNNS